MRSNDEIPKDEMLLARMHGAARARDMEWTSFHPFRKGTGEKIFLYDIKNGSASLDEANSCCAIGSMALAGLIAVEQAFDGTNAAAQCTKYDLESIYRGNDKDDDWIDGDEDNGESLGWAFRCAMTQDISDPETERLIRERSGK